MGNEYIGYLRQYILDNEIQKSDTRKIKITSNENNSLSPFEEMIAKYIRTNEGGGDGNSK